MFDSISRSPLAVWITNFKRTGKLLHHGNHLIPFLGFTLKLITNFIFRAFFILLFKHLTFVGQRACHRTALELCKRLLCLDPDNDPLCATLMVDFFAIKANESRWLINLYNYWEKSKNLSQLPNFAYSIALAYHMQSISTKKPEPSKTEKTTNSNLQQSPEEMSQQADKFLQYAILMFPSVILPMLEKCGIQVDSRTKNHTFLGVQAQNRYYN